MLEALKEEMTLAELALKYEVHTALIQKAQQCLAAAVMPKFLLLKRLRRSSAKNEGSLLRSLLKKELYVKPISVSKAGIVSEKNQASD